MLAVGPDQQDLELCEPSAASGVAEAPVQRLVEIDRHVDGSIRIATPAFTEYSAAPIET